MLTFQKLHLFSNHNDLYIFI